MTFLSLCNWLKPRQRQAKVGRQRQRRHGRTLRAWFVPRLEALEDRCLLSGGISLTPSEPAPQLVGAPITWTATVPNAPSGLVYQFSVGSPGGPFHMVRDFSPDDQFTWAPVQEGTYRIKVTVEDGFDAERTQSAVVTDAVDSRVTGTDAVISPTSNPLVALYSVPAGPEGTVHVEFAVASAQPSWRSTNELPSEPGKSTNVFVAGMLPNTTYEMRDVFSDGTTSAPLSFTTGGLPSNLVFPRFTVQQPPGPGGDLDQDMLFHQFPNAPSNVPNPLATDLSGNVVWYYDVSRAGLTHTYVGQSLVAGGTVLLLGVDQYAPLPATLDVLREIDLAGNVVRETNLGAVNAQLTAQGYHPVYSFTHDVERLPNGDTAVIAPTERSIDVNGTPTEYVGMSIVVLDKNFQVSWAWDAFDHLDVNRGPILGEVMQPGGVDQLSASTPVLPAVDWLHVNAVSWSPADGNLVLSLRNQDWVIKIDYENGAGDGHVVWRLGQGGDFTVNSTDPNPWFSGQHDAHYIDDSTLVLFDDGNTRQASDPTADSRGQVWKLDEQTMTATLVFNVDLGNYSPMFGSAQRLSNGDYSFTSGAQGQAPHQFGQTIEVRPDGRKAYVLQVNKGEYRSFRIQTLYEGVSDQLAGDNGAGQGGDARASLTDGDAIDRVFLGNQVLGGDGGDGQGGALHNLNGSIGTVLDSLMILNALTGGDGQGGGAFNGGHGPGATPSLTLLASAIVFNEAEGGAAGYGSSAAGLGQGGGLYLTPAGDAWADMLTAILANDASTSNDDVFGTLGQI